jgi:hypothetical protein
MRTEGQRQTRKCGQCYELMDVRARVCPHCRAGVFKFESQAQLRRIVVVLVLALTTSLWFPPFIKVVTFFGGIFANQMVASMKTSLLQPSKALGSKPPSARPTGGSIERARPSGSHK